MANDGDRFGQKITRGPRMTDLVADGLRDEILRRKLRPGDKLPPERVLCEQFGVSRPVVREAVRALVAMGLVSVHTGSGLRVAAADSSAVVESMRMFIHGQHHLDYNKLHEVRSVLELAMVERAATLSNHRAVERMRALCEEMHDTLPDVEEASRLDFLFHREIATATNNPFFEVIYDALETGLMDARRATFAYDLDRMARVVVDHRSIVDAVAAGDPDKARAEMLEHLDDVQAIWARSEALVSSEGKDSA